MYKVSEVAEMLSVEKVKIFEVLIVHDIKLAPYITKDKHISYINDVGVREIEKIIFNIIDELETNEILEYKENILEENIKKEDIVSDLIKESENRIGTLKKNIIDLKRELNSLDNDLRHKDDAIINYQEIIDEDIDWIIKLEKQIDILNKVDIKEEVKQEVNKTKFLDKFIK